MNIHLSTWYLKPQKFKDRRNIKLHFLFITIQILKNKPNR